MNMFYLTKYIPNILLYTISVGNISGVFSMGFLQIKSLRSMCVLCFRLISIWNAKFSSEIRDLCFYFMEFTAEKIESYAQVVPHILKNVLITELGNLFLIKCKLVKIKSH